MSERFSGQQIAVNNLQRFNAWIAERKAAYDLQDHIRQSMLTRSEIA
jgi:hypothetical protein